MIHRIVLVLSLFALKTGDLSAQKEITLEDCFTYFKFYPESFSGYRFLSDGLHYTVLEEKGIVRYSLLSGREDSIVLSRKNDADGFDEYALSDDESSILLQGSATPVYRHSILAEYRVWDRKSRRLTAVGGGEQLQLCLLSPDGSKAAYVLNNNLFIQDLRGDQTVQVTNDGKKNEIINGLPDWVYEEEFSPVSGKGMLAAKWSPDGQKLAYIRFDESKVPEYPLHWHENNPYSRQTSFKYPKVGESNASVRVYVHKWGETSPVEVRDFAKNADDYVPRIHWTQSNTLTITRLNRAQDTLELWHSDLQPDENGVYSCGLLLRETDPAYVEVHDNLAFLKDERRFLWSSEKDGFNHLYLYDLSGKALRQLTQGAFDVTAFYGVDERKGKFYFQAATPTPLDRQIWEGDLNTGARRLITPSRGTHDAEFSPTFDHFTLNASDINTPPSAFLFGRMGDTLRIFTTNSRQHRLRREYGFVNTSFVKVPAANGDSLNAWILKPRNFDPTRRYPVLFDIYGGPGSQTVQNQYDGYKGPWHQMLTQKGYIVVSVDNRGTGARGRDFKKCTQLQLGRYETEDQIAAARYLATLPYIDGSRIGIWGWSFGGYLSSSCLLKGADVFKAAAAVAPVTNWKWYDSAYTERYMRTTDDNSRGYEDNSPINFVSRLRGGNYLICHGVADDNVHWQQTVEMINALIREGKQFETLYYPNRNHGIYGDNATRHLFTKLTDFILKKI